MANAVFFFSASVMLTSIIDISVYGRPLIQRIF